MTLYNFWRKNAENEFTKIALCLVHRHRAILVNSLYCRNYRSFWRVFYADSVMCSSDRLLDYRLRCGPANRCARNLIFGPSVPTRSGRQSRRIAVWIIVALRRNRGLGRGPGGAAAVESGRVNQIYWPEVDRTRKQCAIYSLIPRCSDSLLHNPRSETRDFHLQHSFDKLLITSDHRFVQILKNMVIFKLFATITWLKI